MKSSVSLPSPNFSASSSDSSLGNTARFTIRIALTRKNFSNVSPHSGTSSAKSEHTKKSANSFKSFTKSARTASLLPPKSKSASARFKRSYRISSTPTIQKRTPPKIKAARQAAFFRLYTRLSYLLNGFSHEIAGEPSGILGAFWYVVIYADGILTVVKQFVGQCVPKLVFAGCTSDVYQRHLQLGQRDTKTAVHLTKQNINGLLYVSTLHAYSNQRLAHMVLVERL